MSSPILTVIIPTYNHAEFLREAVCSVLAQSFTDFKLLILDDCSSDSTADVVRDIKDTRVSYTRHQGNVGLVANWTFGINMASGKYVAILSDDDKYKPDFLLKRVSAFRDHNGLVAATGAFECCDNTGAFIRFSRRPSETERVSLGRDLIAFALGITGEWFNGATLYKLDAVRSLWPQAMMAGTALDFSLHIRLSLLPRASVYYLPDADIMLRIHSDQESRRNSLYLAECSAKLALQLWRSELKRENADIKALFRRRLSKDLNHYARMLWDRGNGRDARNMFYKSFLINPFQLATLVKFLRSFLVSPEPVDK